MPNALAYVRVSKEKEDGVSPSTQLAKIRQYASLHELTLLDVYRDLDLSGTSDERPAFQELIARVKQGGIDAVIVYRIDRFSRSLRDFIVYLETMRQSGADLISVNEAFDASTPMGRAMVGLLAVFAQLESETIGERVRDNMRHIVRTKGKYLGRYEPTGYKRTPNGLIIDDTEAPLVHWIFSEYLAGAGTRKIAGELTLRGLPSPTGKPFWRPSTINEILRSRIYLGEVAWDTVTVPGAHEPLIDEITWNKVQRIMDSRAPQNTGAANPRVFSGLLRCGLCGSMGEVRNGRGDAKRYYCAKRRHSGSDGCANIALDEATLESRLLSLIAATIDANVVTATEKIITGEPQPVDEAAIIERRLERLRSMMNRLFDDHYETGVITKEQFVERNARYLEEQQTLRQQLGSLTGGPLGQANLEVYRHAVDALRAGWEGMTVEERRLALNQVVECIIWYPDRMVVNTFFGGQLELPYVEVFRGIGYMSTEQLPRCPICNKPCHNVSSHYRTAHDRTKLHSKA